MTRNGGDLVVETLEKLGYEKVFGIPGQHALGLFDALTRSRLEFVSSRIENNAAFAADGYARASGQPAALFVSTGPGALTSLAGLQEAYATSVPMVVVSSQVPRVGLGGNRTGHLHQLDDQTLAARNVVKSTTLIQQSAEIPSAIARAHSEAISHPQGPVWIEIPQDILLDDTTVPPVQDVQTHVLPVPARAELLDAAAAALEAATRIVIIAGGGVRRSGAEAELLALAEALRAPVVTSPGGKGAFPWNHPLSMQSWIEDQYTTDVLENADVVVAIGTALGEVTSNYFTMRPQGLLIHIDAECRVLESHLPALAIHADARDALAGLVRRVQARPSDGVAEQATRELLDKVGARLDSQDLAKERGILAAIRAGVPDDATTFWDMTIAGYWAWSCWDARSGQFHSAQGAGGIGWGYGAALGGAAANGGRVLAVSGDGGAMYSIAELAVARQHNLPVTWLIVDDGGYGILREYMNATFGKATATELSRPDFVALAESFSVPAQYTTPADLADTLATCWTAEGPNVIVLQERLAMFAPTHLEIPA